MASLLIALQRGEDPGSRRTHRVPFTRTGEEEAYAADRRILGLVPPPRQVRSLLAQPVSVCDSDTDMASPDVRANSGSNSAPQSLPSKPHCRKSGNAGSHPAARPQGLRSLPLLGLRRRRSSAAVCCTLHAGCWKWMLYCYSFCGCVRSCVYSRSVVGATDVSCSGTMSIYVRVRACK